MFDDITIVNYLISSDLKSMDLGKDLYGDREHSRRKVKFWIKVWREDWGNHNCDWYYRYKIEIKVENLKKRTFGGWKTYETKCSWNNADIIMNIPEEQESLTKSCGGGTVFYDLYSFVVYNLRGHS